MAQYSCDKTQRVTVRFSPRQFDFLREIAAHLGVSPSDAIRMMVNSGMVAWLNQRGDGRRENESTCIDN